LFPALSLKGTGNLPQQKPLHLWPGFIIVLLQWLLRFGVIYIMPENLIIAVLGVMGCGLALVVWWLFFSRASRFDRWGALILIMVALIVTWLLAHKSMKLMPFVAYILPVVCLAFVIGALAGRSLSQRSRRITIAAAVLLACALCTFVKTGGTTGSLQSNFAWRWSNTPEDRLLNTDMEQMTLPPDASTVDTGFDWPGFRGPDRDGIIHGTQIVTDWTESPPAELWRRPVGPGWSSFAVHGSLFYTQEQRGNDEVVSCYDLAIGKPVWRHRDTARFWESNGGAGPRGTPTFSGGQVYALGATGILNVLDALDGSVLWSRNAGSDTDTKIPTWGFSGSPLVIDDAVIVAVAGSLIAYERSTGDPLWSRMAGGDCYSSPHLYHTAGIAQILLQNDAGIISVAPTDGTLLWEHEWPGHPIVQPAVTANNDILISTDERSGIRRISVALESGQWTVKELWTSKQVKPYFNDSVPHKGHVYGFVGRSLACIDIENGTRKWRGGIYGRGQLILLADQDLLLVVSEKGELALVEADPNQFTEIARIPAVEGKTWNHPVLVGDILLVRNAREMAAFRLALMDI
jgi:outer membrane protein assembly factor BamB